MTTLQGSWVWYELMSPDPDASKAFYETVVGWQVSTGHGDNTDYGFIANADGSMTGGLLRLSSEMAEHGARPCWLGYIGVDDVDAAVTAIEIAGGKTLMPARDVAMAGRFAMVADPGGAAFYIMTPTPPPGGGESTVFTALPHSGRAGWNELIAADPSREIGFYTGLFGWSLPDAMDMGAMGKYQFIAHDGVTVGAIMPLMPQVPAAMWNHYFWVAGIDAAKGLIEANGGQVVNGPMEVPGGLWTIQAIDPQGAFFCLVGPR